MRREIVIPTFGFILFACFMRLMFWMIGPEFDLFVRSPDNSFATFMSVLAGVGGVAFGNLFVLNFPTTARGGGDE